MSTERHPAVRVAVGAWDILYGLSLAAWLWISKPKLRRAIRGKIERGRLNQSKEIKQTRAINHARLKALQMGNRLAAESAGWLLVDRVARSLATRDSKPWHHAAEIACWRALGDARREPTPENFAALAHKWEALNQ